jgi:hypothetical protein
MAMKNILANILIGLAVISGVLGIINYTVQIQILDEDLYKTALDQSGVYAVTTQIVGEKLSEGLVTLQRGIIDQIGIIGPEDTETTIIDKIVLTLLNTVIDTQTPRLVSTLLTNISFEQNVQNYSNQVIEQSVGWLRGDVVANEYFDRIPTPEAVIAFREASLSQLLFQLTSRTFGQKELPICTSSEDIQANLSRALSGNFDSLSCTNNQIQPLLDAFFNSNIANDKIGQAETTIQSKLDAFGITEMIDGVYQVVLGVTQLKQNLLELQSMLRLNLRISYSLIIFSILSLIAGLLLKTASRLKLAIQSLFTVGASVLIITLLYLLIISEVAIYQLNLQNLTTFTSLLSANQNTALLLSLNNALTYMIKHAADFTLMVGIGLTVISATLWVMFDLITSEKVQSGVIVFGNRVKNSIVNTASNIRVKIQGITKKSTSTTAKQAGKRNKK